MEHLKDRLAKPEIQWQTCVTNYQSGEMFHMYYVPVHSNIEQRLDMTPSHKLQSAQLCSAGSHLQAAVVNRSEQQSRRMGKVMGAPGSLPDSHTELWPWATYVTFLCLSFL